MGACTALACVWDSPISCVSYAAAAEGVAWVGEFAGFATKIAVLTAEGAAAL